MGKPASAAGKQSPSRKTVDRGSSARKNAGGSGGKHTRRQGSGKPYTKRCAPTAEKILKLMGTAAGNTAALTATSKTGSGGTRMEFKKIKIADLIPALQDSDFDVFLTGFEPPEIEQLFNSVHDKKITEDDFDVEAKLVDRLQ